MNNVKYKQGFEGLFDKQAFEGLLDRELLKQILIKLKEMDDRLTSLEQKVKSVGRGF